METKSIKSLAYKVLHGNQQGNKVETELRNNGNFPETIKENQYENKLARARQYLLSKKDLMTLEYKKYIRWVCSQDFIIPTGDRTYFDEVDMKLSKLYNAGDCEEFMDAIADAKRVFSL